MSTNIKTLIVGIALIILGILMHTFIISFIGGFLSGYSLGEILLKK